MFTNLDGVYIPITWVSLGLDHVIWGMRPFGYHLTSSLLHAAGAVLLYFLILALLTKDQRSNKDQSGSPPAPPGGNGGTASDPSSLIFGLSPQAWAAAAGALFWAIHPLRAESVAWITERRDVLCGVFFMLALLAYVRMARAAEDADRRRLLLLSLAAYALSLLSKASAMALPAVLLLLDVCPLRRWQPGSRGRLLIEKVPFALLGLGAAWVGARAQLAAGAALSLEQHTMVERMLQAAYGLCLYVYKTLLPVDLSPLYLLGHRLHLSEPRFIAAIVGVVAVTAVVIAIARRRPEPLVAWLSYALLVSPVLGFFQSGPHLAADRFTYLPCAAWSVAIAAALRHVAAVRPQARTGIAAASIAVLALLGILTLGQSRFWRSSIALWDHAVHVDPGNWEAWFYLGRARLSARDVEGAVRDFDQAIAVQPRYADPHNARGWVKLQLGDPDGAIADFSEALRLKYRAPADAYFNRGSAYLRKNDLKAAADDFTRALEVARPDWPLRAKVTRELEGLRRQRPP